MRKTAISIAGAFKEILGALFPRKGGFDFSKENPEVLWAKLPICRDLRGATALSGWLGKKRVIAALSYRHRTVRSLVWNIKYKKDTYSLHCGGYILYRTIVEKFGNVPRLTLIPMPVSRARRRERGYNQCELLAQAIAAHAKPGRFELRTDILYRKKNIKKQTFKNRQERMDGMHGAFEVRISRKPKPNGPVILLDDVITTGSTLREAMECLEKAGYRDVIVLGLAH